MAAQPKKIENAKKRVKVTEPGAVTKAENTKEI